MTHFATADEPQDDGFFAAQLERVRGLGASAEGRASTADRARGEQRGGAARCRLPVTTWCAAGSPVYGMDPFGADPAAHGLEPALALSSYVAEVKRCAAGESAGYGRRFVAERATPASACCRSDTATAGGAGSRATPRCSSRGRRRALVGTVSMDNVTIDLGAGAEAEQLRGAPAILIGTEAEQRITAEDVARAAGNDQLRDQLRADGAGAARLSPRRRAGAARDGSRAVRRTDGPVAPGARWMRLSRRRVRRSRDARRGWSAARSATAVLGRATSDVDVVVDGDPAESARAIARAAGRAACFALSEEFGAWRVSARDSSWQVDVEPLRGGSLQADLTLRDFTVNAIAEPLAGGEPIDPLGGLRDLAERRLRMAGPGAFAEDPLRVLRLARVAVELDLEPEPDTLARAREQSAALTQLLARARVRRAAPHPRRSRGAARSRADARARRHRGGAA